MRDTSPTTATYIKVTFMLLMKMLCFFIQSNYSFIHFPINISINRLNTSKNIRHSSKQNFQMICWRSSWLLLIAEVPWWDLGVLCVRVCVCVRERESENQSKGTLSSVDECLSWAVQIISWAVCVQRRCRDMLMRWRSVREEGAAWRTFRLTLGLIVCLESCCKVGEICLIVPQSCSCLESFSDVKLL